eukprot:3130057-Amphidinium_carterae.1
MDESSKSVATINIANTQDDYTTEDVNRLRQRFPTIPAEDEEDYDEHNEMILNVRQKKDDMTSFSQTLNYVLVHSTKPASEAHSMVGRIMRQSNGFQAWRQLTLHYMQVDIEFNNLNFLDFAQPCNQAGTQQQNTSHDNTTSG